MRRLLLLIVMLGHCFYSLAGDDWKLDKNEDGIKIYTRKTTLSDFKEYKGITYVKARRKEVAVMVLNITDYVNWFPDCLESDIVSRESLNELVVYYRIDCPWPTQDRDAVVEMCIERQDEIDVTTIWFKDKTGIKPKKDGVTRVGDTSGFWRFSQIGEQTKIEYQCLTDPSGNIPAWVANLFVVDAPFETLSAIKKAFK
ncbi:MAG: hypothetical protein HUJ25_04915 [Crocinitomicaceae bacterium]|nr:hypothetical protein [Crocinitomicaceae bacterium]